MTTKETRKEDLGKLINQLLSPKARARVVQELIGKHTIPASQAKEVVDYLRSQSRVQEAAIVARDAGLKDVAIELYGKCIKVLEEDGHYLEAARLAQSSGLMPDETKRLYEMHLVYLEEIDHFREAAKIAAEAGMHERDTAYKKLDELLNEK